MRTRRLEIRDWGMGVGGWRLEIGEWMLVIVFGFVIFDFTCVVPKTPIRSASIYRALPRNKTRARLQQNAQNV